MEKKENRTIEYTYIPSEEWENVNGTEDNYFANDVKKKNGGEWSYTNASEVFELIANKLENSELASARKEVKYNGKQIEYTFEGKKNCETVEVKIPTKLLKDQRHVFINNDVRVLDELCNTTKSVRNIRMFKESLKKTATAIIAAVTLAASYAGTRKIVTTLSEHPNPEHLTYNLYYGNVMSEEQFNENVQRLYESHQRQKEREQQKELSKRK